MNEKNLVATFVTSLLEFTYYWQLLQWPRIPVFHNFVLEHSVLLGIHVFHLCALDQSVLEQSVLKQSVLLTTSALSGTVSVSVVSVTPKST